MLKPKKNLNIKKNSKFLKPWLGKKVKNTKIKAKSIFRIRKILKKKSYFLNPSFQEIINTKNVYSKRINIRITPNNIFCTLKNNKKKTLKVASSGKYKIKTSRKTLKYSTKNVVSAFLEEIKKLAIDKRILVNLIGPTRIRKSVLEQISKHFRKRSLIINVKDKKCFNGCRPPKKKRKKQKGLRIFK